jgi:hypothetical protein
MHGAPQDEGGQAAITDFLGNSAASGKPTERIDTHGRSSS